VRIWQEKPKTSGAVQSGILVCGAFYVWSSAGRSETVMPCQIFKRRAVPLQWDSYTRTRPGNRRYITQRRLLFGLGDPNRSIHVFSIQPDVLSQRKYLASR
jgi:hypothetical protein